MSDRHRSQARFPFLVVLVLALVGCATGAGTSPGDSSRTSAPPEGSASAGSLSSASASPAATPSLVAPLTIDEAGATKLTVRPFADWVAVSDGFAWVAVGNAVKRFDGRDGAELGAIPISEETCLAMDVGFGSVWVGACHPTAPAIVRINATTGDLDATIALDRDLVRQARGEQGGRVRSTRPGNQGGAGHARRLQDGDGISHVVVVQVTRWRPVTAPGATRVEGDDTERAGQIGDEASRHP